MVPCGALALYSYSHAYTGLMQSRGGYMSLDMNIARTLYSREDYERTRHRHNADLFTEDIKPVYRALTTAHERFEQDFTTVELFSLWKADNPVATRAEVEEMRGLFDDVEDAKRLSPEVLDRCIESVWQRSEWTKLAGLSLSASEGDTEAAYAARQFLETMDEHSGEEDFGIVDLEDPEIDEVFDHTGVPAFNIRALSHLVPGLPKRRFGIIFAPSNAGKSTFVTSICTGPGGFIDQGHKVLIIGNEEDIKTAVARAKCCVTGWDRDMIIADRETAQEKMIDKLQGKAIFADGTGWDIEKVAACIERNKPDVVLIDQLDKVRLPGRFEKGYEMLGELYLQTRQMAKKYDCAMYGITQAANEANGKTKLTFDMLSGAKVGKAAEADLIIGIGLEKGESLKENLTINDFFERFITVSKNKITGWHGTVIAQIQPAIARYVD